MHNLFFKKSLLAIIVSFLIFISLVFFGFNYKQQYFREITNALQLEDKDIINSYNYGPAVDIFRQYTSQVLIYEKEISFDEFQKNVNKIGLRKLNQKVGLGDDLSGLNFSEALKVNGISIGQFFTTTLERPKLYTWNGYDSNNRLIRIDLYILQSNLTYTLEDKIIRGNIIVIVGY